VAGYSGTEIPKLASRLTMLPRCGMIQFTHDRPFGNAPVFV